MYFILRKAPISINKERKPHSDALVYTNRHNLPAEEAVKLSNTDLYNLSDGNDLESDLLSEKYRVET